MVLKVCDVGQECLRECVLPLGVGVSLAVMFKMVKPANKI